MSIRTGIRLVWLGTLGLFVGAGLHGQTLDAVTADREAQLEEAIGRLREVRERIEAERLPLARELNFLDAKAHELEARLRKARRLRDSQSVDLDTLRLRVEARQREVDYVARTLLPSFTAEYDAGLSPAERGEAGESIRRYNLLLEKPDLSDAEKLEAGLSLISQSLDGTKNLIGGRMSRGEALGPDGTVLSGDFIQIGPLVYFTSADEQVAGLVTLTRSLEPELQELRGPLAERIQAVARTGEGSLPVDPTLGDALAVDRTKDTLAEHLIKGGIWVYPILLFALVATLVAIGKTIQIFSVRHPRPRVIHELVAAVRNGDAAEAREIAAAQPRPARDMLVAAVEHSAESTDMVEEVMYEWMLTTQPRYERFLNIIAVTAAAAPLLGLLGTVTGIIKTFRLMSVFGAGDPRPLISGISEALITTELGLILAIPALVMHAILSRKVAGIMARMEKTAVAFVNGLSRRAVQPAAQES